MVIECWECKNNISSNAITCPHCGAPVLSQCPECGEWAMDVDIKAIYHEPKTKVKTKTKIFPFFYAYAYEKVVRPAYYTYDKKCHCRACGYSNTKQSDKLSAVVGVIFLSVILFIICAVYVNNYVTERKNAEEKAKQEQIKEQINEQMETTASEDFYKSNCRVIFYDEVFSGNSNLVGEYVKLHVYVYSKDTYDKMDIEYYSRDYGLEIGSDYYYAMVLHSSATTGDFSGNLCKLVFEKNSPKTDYHAANLIVYGKVIQTHQKVACISVKYIDYDPEYKYTIQIPNLNK